MNYAFDWAWFKSDTSIVIHTKRFLNFLYSKGIDTYTQSYLLDGTPMTSYGPGESQIGANAVAVLASDNLRDFDFVKALWKQPMSSGQWRYDNGLIQMLSLLHVSGKVKAYGSPGLNGAGIGNRAIKPVGFSVRTTGQELSLDGLTGNVRLLDASGRELRRVDATRSGSAKLTVPHAGLWLLDAGVNGSRTIAIP